MSLIHLNELEHIHLRAEREKRIEEQEECLSKNNVFHEFVVGDETTSYSKDANNDKAMELSGHAPQSTEIKSKADGKYPKFVFLIILNEFCERFSYYGIRTVLFIYLTQFLGKSENKATVIYHLFTVVCYFTPLLGAILADGFIGLYKTILYVSIVYLIGEIILTLTSLIPLGAPNLAGPLVGLFIIAVGTGGIKPCVSAFGGNQFKKSQTRYIETFFSVFYMSINIGSMIGTILTPILRSDVKCFGADCYPLAFGIPSCVMLISLIFFVAGTPFYKRDFQRGKGNIIIKTGDCIIRALMNKVAKRNDPTKKAHWLEYADDKYDSKLISDVKAFCKVLLVFLPLPIFWALYDQQGSRWTSQAQQLNGHIGHITIKPDQFQAVNPFFIIFLVPFFDTVVYPLFAKVNLLKKQLQRMSVGLILAILAFLIAAILESQMEKASAALNRPNQIRVLNLSPCNLVIDYENQVILNVPNHQYLNNKPMNIDPYFLDQFKDKSSLKFEVDAKCEGLRLNKTQIKISNQQKIPKTLIFYLDETSQTIKSVEYSYDQKRKVIGTSQIKFASFNLNKTSTFKVSLVENMMNGNILDTEKFEKMDKNKLISSINESGQYLKVDYAEYKLEIFESSNVKLSNKILLETCGRYTVLLFWTRSNNATLLDMAFLTDIYPNGISLFWQLIQIFVMTVGEIMFSVSGISFAYSQAPESMKSVLQAAWCLTIAIGNLVVVFVAEAKMVKNQVYEYVTFAGLLSLATIGFMIIAFFYKYAEDMHMQNESNKEEEKMPQKFKLLNFGPFKRSSVKDVTLVQVKPIG